MEGPLDKKVQATITSELKEKIQASVKENGFESEAEFVRVAIIHFIEHRNPPPEPVDVSPDIQHHDLKERLDVIAWLLTVIVVLVSTLAAKLLKTEPARLLDYSLRVAAHDRKALKQQLGVGWRAFNQTGEKPHSANGAQSEKV